MAISLASHARRELIVGQELAWAAATCYLVFESDSGSVTGYARFYVPGMFRTALPAVLANNTKVIS